MESKRWNSHGALVWGVIATLTLHVPRHISAEEEPYMDSVTAVAFSPDGSQWATADGTGKIRLWDSASGEHVRVIGKAETNCIAFSPNGGLLAAPSNRSVNLWNTSGGGKVKSLEGHTRWVSCIAFSPDGRLLASGSSDKTVRVWEVATGKEVHTLTGHGKPVGCVGFSPDGKALASGSNDASIKLWDVSSGTETRTFVGHTKDVQALSFTPDGKLLASAARDGTAKFWDVATGEVTHTMSVAREELQPHWLTWSRDCSLLVCGKENHRWLPYEEYPKNSWWATVYAARSGEIGLTLKAHGFWVLSAAFSADNRFLVTGSADGTAKLWDVTTGNELHSVGELVNDFR